MGKMRKVHKTWLKSLKGRDHFNDRGVDGRIILKWMKECERVDWINLAQNRDHCELL
jgi:hypothetical protein